MKKGFALLYVILFLAIMCATVFGAWAVNFSSVKLARKSNNSIMAYNMAKAGIEQGFANYKTSIGTSDPRTATLNLKNPSSNTCPSAGTTSSTLVDRSSYAAAPVAISSSNGLSAAQLALGVYDNLFCYNKSTNAIYVEAIGHYLNDKIALKADIKHNDTINCTYNYQIRNNLDEIVEEGNNESCTGVYDTRVNSGGVLTNGCPFLLNYPISATSSSGLTTYTSISCSFNHKDYANGRGDTLNIYQTMPK